MLIRTHRSLAKFPLMQTSPFGSDASNPYAP